MRKERAYWALAEVAKREGIEVETVIAHIDTAIFKAVQQAREKNDTDTLARWKLIPCAGDIPTAIELISYLGDAVLNIS